MNEMYVEHLQGLVRIPTVSCPDPESELYAPFDALHQYLEDTYPNIHRICQKKIFGRAGLMLRWQGKDPQKAPMVLMAHQDVVPTGDESQWTHPPFGAELADGCLWGRGAVDCKQIVLGGLEAVERLIAEGFCPECDVYLCYGANEEISAPDKTAPMFVKYFQEQQIHPGLVMDEGHNMTPYHGERFDGYLCNIDLGEKARTEIELYVESTGGHAMEPGKGSALGLLAKGIVAVEANPLPYRLTELVKTELMALAIAAPEEHVHIYREPEKYFNELCALAKEDKKLDSLLHTTMAVTMAHGSDTSNVLPRIASAVIDCRIMDGDTIDSVISHLRSVLPEGVQLRYDAELDTPEASEVGSDAFSCVQAALEKVYGTVHMVPGLLSGGTDSKYFQKICRNVFRCGLYVEDSRWGNAHSIDEKIPCDCLERGVESYYELIKAYASK